MSISKLLPDIGLTAAWARRNTYGLVDVLHVELAERFRAALTTTDSRCAGSYPQAHVP